ncbi:DUF1206 domain-containing protein [Roseibium sp. FZY0029]|uniref:DUF1206 domain-containing protein n=1 Tax=Roseibium sp. FZY0029 TaxID=3116647 RepID=UPI002EB9E698|nr:DUF1206 domain-containing protein [Roseibium sp. FZY0029]
MRHSNWLQAAARAGYLSRGVVYGVVSFFAILASIGAGSSKGTKGALVTLLSQPFGSVLVAVLVAGLFGFVVWRLVQAVLDADNHGWSAQGIVVRLALLASAATYSALAIYAIGLLGLTGSGGGKLLPNVLNAVSQGLGQRLFVAGLSLVFLGIAAAHWWKAYSGKYTKHFDENEAPMRVVHVVSVLGLGARGVVFALLSAMIWLGIEGAATAEGDLPSTLDALRYIQELPYGRIMLFALAVGLMIFAIYSFVESRWRRVSLS